MRYPGGKGRCYQHIISLMPPHRVYVETHLGGGAVLRHKRPAQESFGVEKDALVVSRWAGRTPGGMTLVHGDALEFLDGFRFVGDELVYCDPPYPRETRSHAAGRPYRHDYVHKDHVELLNRLRKLPCAAMVSSYDNDLYAEALRDWRVVRFAGDSHAGPRTETVWMNFPEPPVLHDYDHIGGDFRGRERQRRRRGGLSRRIGEMPALERGALFHDLARRFGPELRAVLDAVP